MTQPNSKDGFSDDDLVKTATAGKQPFKHCFENSPYFKFVELELTRNWLKGFPESARSHQKKNPELSPEEVKAALNSTFWKETLPTLLKEVVDSLYSAIIEEEIVVGEFENYVLSIAQVSFFGEGKDYPISIEKAGYSQEGLLSAARIDQQACLNYVAESGLIPQINEYLEAKGHKEDHYTDILLEATKRFHRRIVSKNNPTVKSPLGMFLTQLWQSGFYIRKKGQKKEKRFSVTDFTNVAYQRLGVPQHDQGFDNDVLAKEKAYLRTSIHYQRKLLAELEALSKGDEYRYDTIVRGNEMTEFYYRREMIEAMVGIRATKCRRLLGTLNTARKASKPNEQKISQLEKELAELKTSEGSKVIADFIWLHEMVINRWLNIGTEQLKRKLVPKKFRREGGKIAEWHIEKGVKKRVDGKVVGDNSRKVYSAWRTRQLPPEQRKRAG